jgi:phosphotriesterase-related protein
MVPNEEKVLRAAGHAQAETGAPVSVHIYNYRPNRLAHHVLDILADAGADLERVAICHLDTRPDPDYIVSIADRGAFVEFDTFGIEFYSDSAYGQMPRDTDRMELVVETIERGYVDHILMSHDVCWKTLLVEYGGWGYAHISKHIEPRLRDAGVTDQQILAMRVYNPARWLTY